MSDPLIEPAALTHEERAHLVNAYGIIDLLSYKARHANFSLTVQLAESLEVFHRMVNAAEELKVTRGEFIAIHALGACARQIDGLNDGQGDAELKACLFDWARELMGDEGADNLEAYVKGLTNPIIFIQYDDGNWEKIGLMINALDMLDRFADLEPESLNTPDLYENYKSVVTELMRAADSCGDMGTQMASFYDTRRLAIAKVLDAAQTKTPAAFLPPAPPSP